MWSMIRRPGDSKTEIAAAWDCFFMPIGVDLTYLLLVSFGLERGRWLELVVQMESIGQYQLGQDDCRTLIVDCLPAVIVQVLDLQHSRICITSTL